MSCVEFKHHRNGSRNSSGIPSERSGHVAGRDESRDRGPAPGEHAVIHALEFFPRPETDIFLGGEKAFVDLKRWMALRKVGIDHG